MTPLPTETELAIIAAQQASAGTGELLRFVREGALGDSFAFAEDTIEQLAEALKLAIEIEYPRMADDDRTHGGDAEGVELLGQLLAALVRFLEGWA